MKETDFKKTRKECKLYWKNIVSSLTESILPSRIEWFDLFSINYVLNNIAQDNGKHNYMFLPTSGGLELEGALLKDNYIDLKAGSRYSIKPKRLVFEYIDENPLQSYFWLEGDVTFRVFEDGKLSLEPVVDYDLYDREYRIFGEYEGDCYTIKNASFVIFSKGSLYNGDRLTDDGRHNKMSMDEFRDYIIKNYT